MANQTARRKLRGRPRADFLQFYPLWSTSAETAYYAGAAVQQKLQVGTGANDGKGVCDKTLDGSVQGVLRGVIVRNVTVPATAAAFASLEVNRYGLPLATYGTARFNCVSGYTPTLADVGLTAWFHTDNEVSTVPPTAAGSIYPQFAGTIIDVPSATEVLVDMSRHIGRTPRREFMSFQVDWATTGISFLDKGAAAAANCFQFGRRIRVNRCAAITIVAADQADAKIGISKSNGTDVDLTFGTNAEGVTEWGEILLNFDNTDTLGAVITATSVTGTVKHMFVLELIPLDQ